MEVKDHPKSVQMNLLTTANCLFCVSVLCCDYTCLAMLCTVNVNHTVMSVPWMSMPE